MPVRLRGLGAEPELQRHAAGAPELRVPLELSSKKAADVDLWTPLKKQVYWRGTPHQGCLSTNQFIDCPFLGIVVSIITI